MDLREYERIKFRLAELLRSVGALDSGEPRRLADELHDLFGRLAEDRFNLVVVGRFSRGKTSLMNAVLGTGRLPTGIRPLTSVITTVTYGSSEKAVIRSACLGIPEEIPLAALPQFITEEGNSGNHRGVGIAEVQLPIELLRRGFYFIDTPGLGSPIVENTRTTERFLPQADAFVLVTSYEGPLSEEEVRFLRTAAAAGQKVFIVINKQDIAAPVEREDALRYLREQLRGLLDRRDLEIFSLSARDGLAAKMHGDASLLETSGIAAFENELVRFLVDEKSREFLVGMCRRVGEALRKLPDGPQMLRLDETLTVIAREVGGRSGSPSSRASAGMPGLTAKTPSRHAGACAICAQVLERSFDFLRDFQYDITVSPEHRRRLADRGGLCGFHTWIYEQMASPRGTCVGYADVLDEWASRLLAAVAPCRAGEIAGDRIACLLCEAEAASETAAVAAIADRLRRTGEAALAALSGVCLPHLRPLLAALGDSPMAAKLLAHEAALLRRMAEDMRRYALKHDGLRRYLASDEETRAADRALMVLAGHRRLNLSACS
jgi:hypothetical protein